MRLPRLSLAAALLALAACAAEKPKPTAEEIARRPATLLAPTVTLTGPNADAAAGLDAALRSAVRKGLVERGVNVTDDPSAAHAAAVKLAVSLTYWGMDGASGRATLTVEKGGAEAGSFEHATGTHPGEGEGQKSFTLEKSTAEYPDHVAGKLLEQLFASPLGASLAGG